MIKRLLVIALATVIGFTSIPITAYASQTTEVIMEEHASNEDIPFEEAVSVEDVIVEAQQPVQDISVNDEVTAVADILYSGSCNPTINWYIDATNTLYVTGSGNTKVVTGGDSWVDYKYFVKSIVIEEGVTTLHSRAFSNFSYLESVTLPSTLKTIEANAFSDCYNLSKVEIAEGLETIGNAAFIGCRMLDSITLPETLTSLGIEAFEGCENLWFIEIPEGITQIGADTFLACYKLMDVDLPETLESIGTWAFANCIMLSDLELPESVTSIGESAFRYCDSLEEVYIPGKATLGDYVFDGCNGLISIELGEGITETGKYMFKNCDGIEQVKLPSTLTKIADGTFYGCKSISDIDLPSKLSVIGASAFYQCNSLKEMYLPASLTQIGDSVFDSCINLKNLFFMGSKELWDAMSIGSTNAVLYAAELNYNSCNKNHVWKEADCVSAKHCEKCGAVLGEPLGHSFTQYELNGDGTKTAKCDNCDETHTTYVAKHTGTISKTITWGLDYDDTLHIEGTGQIGNLASGVVGYWSSLRGIIKKVVIEEGITYVGNYTFDQCVNLEEVYMADSVTAIGEHVFNGCASLKKVEMSDNLETIGAYAFYGCAALEEADIPESVTAIGDFAFCECRSLKEVAIPKGVTSLGEQTFILCESLETLKLPRELTSIGYYAFGACYGIKQIIYSGNAEQWESISMDEGNEYLSQVPLSCVLAEGSIGDDINWSYYSNKELNIIGSGAVPNYTYVSSAPWLPYGYDITAVNIDEEITSIGSYAFYNMNALESVHISANVTSIGEAAFAYCNSLESVTVDEANSFFVIKDGVLYNKDMTRLLWYPYTKTDAEYEIPETVTSIDAYAFVGNTYLQTLKLTENIRSFADNTFKECNSLSKVIWDGSYDTYYDITRADKLGSNNDAFLSADFEILGLPYVYDINDNGTEDVSDDTVKITWAYGKLAGEVVVPETIENLPVTEIGESAFMARHGITKLIIPDSVTTIGKQAFNMCNGLSEVVLSDNIKEIPELTFQMCGVLEKVTLPSKLEKIGEGAFSDCTVLREMVIPETVTVMEDGIFMNCKLLEKVEIKGAVESLGVNTFAGCATLHTVILPSTLKEIGNLAFTNCISLNNIVLPESLESLGQGAFFKCTKLQNIILPSLVTTVGEGCFMDCSALETVDILSDLNYIPKSCFQRCTSLKNIVLPEIMRTIGETAFAQCSSLEEINLPEGVLMIQDQAFCQCSSLKSITVPKNVVFLGEAAFAECTNLKSARIEGQINMLWGNTFRESGLTSVTLPGSLGYISAGDFYKCPLSYVGWLGTEKSLEKLTWETGGNDTFTAMKNKITVLCPWDYIVNSDGVSCTIETLNAYKIDIKDAEVIIPESLDGYKVTALDTGALRDEKNVTSVYIPDTVTEIGQYAFYGCSSLESVRLPETLETIGTAAFRECLKLDNVVLPRSLKLMEQHAFLGCASLKSITIPGNISTIPSSAFKECSSLETVIIEEGVEFIEMVAFGDCINLKKVVLPESLISLEVSSFGSSSKVKDVVFYVHAESNAATYCEGWKYNCHFIYPLKGVSIADVIYVDKDGSAQIVATPVPETTTDEYEFIYELVGSDEGLENEVALLSGDTIVGKAFGEAILTVTEKNTGFSDQAVVKVIPSNEGEMVLELTEEIIGNGLQFGDSRTLEIDTDIYGVLSLDMFVFESSDEDVITVDENGVITSVYEGNGKAEAIISATLKEDCYDRQLTLKVTAIPIQTESISIDIPILGDLWEEDGTIIVNKSLVTGGSHEIIVEVPTYDLDGNETNPEIIWSTTNSKIAYGTKSTEYGYLITIPADAEGYATVTATADDFNRASAQINIEIRDYSPRIGATAVTLNTHKTTGENIPLYAAYDGTITDVYVADNSALRAEYDAEKDVVTIIPNEIIAKKSVVTLVVETEQGEYSYAITVNVSNKLPAVTFKQQEPFNLFYKSSRANIAFTVKNEEIASVELCDTPTFTTTGFENNILTVVYANKDPMYGYVNGKPDTSVVLKIYLEGYRTPIEKKLNISAKEIKPVLMTDTKNAKVTYLSEGGAALKILDKASGHAIYWNDTFTVSSEAEGSYVHLRTAEDDLIIEPILNAQNKFANNKASYQVKLNVLEENWIKPISVSYTINLAGAPKLTVGSKTVSVNTLLENTAQTVVTADCVNASAPEYEVIANSKNAKALSENLLSGEGWELVANVPIGTANGSYAYKVIPKWGEVAGAALAVTVKVENMNPTIKTAAKSNTLTLNSAFATAQTQIIPSSYRGIAEVNYNITPQGKAKTLENAKKIDVTVDGWDLTATFKDREDLPASGSYKYDVEATLTLENGVTVTLKKIVVTVKVSVPKPKVTLGKTSINMNRLYEGEVEIPVTVTGDYQLAGMEVVNDKSNKLEPWQICISEENGRIVVEVLDDTIKNGTYKYKLTPALKLKGEEYQRETMYSALTLSVKVISGTPSLKVSAKGSIDLLKRDTGIVYTITGGTNFNYTVENVNTGSFWLDGKDADKFTVEYAGINAKGQHMVCVKAKTDEVFSTKIANKFNIVASIYGMEDEVMTQLLSVTPKQSSIKAAATGDFNFYQAVRNGSVDIKITTPAGVKVAKVDPVEKGTTIPKGAVSYQMSDEDQDGIFELTYRIIDASKLKVGAKYKIVLAVTPEGMAENMKPQNLTVTFTVKK